jgi:hypothetical protein
MSDGKVKIVMQLYGEPECTQVPQTICHVIVFQNRWRETPIDHLFEPICPEKREGQPRDIPILTQIARYIDLRLGPAKHPRIVVARGLKRTPPTDREL